MALTKEQQSLKDAITRSNKEYRNNKGKVSEATRQATASADILTVDYMSYYAPYRLNR